MHAVGVNPYDTYMRAGTYAIKPALPYTPGADAAGVMDQVGAGVAAGRTAIASTSAARRPAKRTARTRRRRLRAAQVHRLPDRISFAQGAGVFVPYVTAWRALFGRANARAGDTVLIHGASGGVGIAATQFAVAAGVTVIGTAGTDEGVARGHGAGRAPRGQSPRAGLPRPDRRRSPAAAAPTSFSRCSPT